MASVRAGVGIRVSGEVGVGDGVRVRVRSLQGMARLISKNVDPEVF